VSEIFREKGKEYARFLETLTPEQLAHGNEVNYMNAQAEFSRFSSSFEVGICYMCEKPITSFSKKSPCPHWLLKPKGFKKNDLIAVAQKYGFYQIQSFLRWVANQEAFARNINDLSEGGQENYLKSQLNGEIWSGPFPVLSLTIKDTRRHSIQNISITTSRCDSTNDHSLITAIFTCRSAKWTSST
jgi:hypothetical protein